MVILRSSKMGLENLEIHREYLEIFRDWKAKKKARMLRGYSELANQKKLSKKKGFRRLSVHSAGGEIMSEVLKKFSAVKSTNIEVLQYIHIEFFIK